MKTKLFYGCETRCVNLVRDEDGSWRCLSGWFSDGDSSEVYQQCDSDCEDFCNDLNEEDEF
jgi:hypothetical protein